MTYNVFGGMLNPTLLLYILLHLCLCSSNSLCPSPQDCNIQRLNYDDCLEDKREDSQHSLVLCCVPSYMHTHMSSSYK